MMSGVNGAATFLNPSSLSVNCFVSSLQVTFSVFSPRPPRLNIWRIAGMDSLIAWQLMA